MASEVIYQDASQDNGLMTFIRKLPEKPSSTIRIFDRTEYYTVHGEDAVFTAKELFKTTGVIKYYGRDDKKLEYVVLNKSTFEKWIQELLLVRQYRVEIYETQGSSKRNEWILTRKGSPGNLADFEDMLFTFGDSSKMVGVMAVKLGGERDKRVVGVGYVNTTDRKILICEVVDNEHFSNLEALLVQLAPSECLVPGGDNSADYVKLKEIVKRSSVMLTERKKSEFTSKDVIQDLNRLLKFDKGVETAMHLPEINKTTSMESLSALIKFLELLTDEDSSLGHYRLATFDTSQYVRLDSAGVQALNLMPSPADRNKNQSLYGVLNRCCTMQGQRLLAQWIKQPLVDLNKITERQNLVGSFVDDSALRQLLFDDYLKKIPDYQKLAGKFALKRANLQDLYRVYQSLKKLPQLIEQLDSHQGHYLPLMKSYFSDTLMSLLNDFTNFLGLVETTLDLSLVDKNEYVLNAQFDETLAELRQSIQSKEDAMTKARSRAAKDLNLESVKLESTGHLGYFLRLTLKDEKALRGNRLYTIIDSNKNGGVRFRTADLTATNEEYLSLRAEFEETQKSVVTEIMKIAAGYVDSMLRLGSLMAELDVIVGLAVAASMAPATYVKPKLHPKESGILKLSESRHPCLELQDNTNCIPNDVKFDQDKRFLIITGPNMGGKSTYLRTIGITVLMAQIGSYVPCDSAEISIVDAILTRFGCQDSISFGVSSFMLEMIEMSSILRVATASSLLLIDELGRGTSTYDGFGLAWAICEKIAVDIKSYAAVATHFHRLTELEETVASVQNLHVTTLIGSSGPTFLYRIKEGVCDRSFGIHLAELVHFPEKALQYAKKKAEELEDFQGCTLEKYPDLVGDNAVAVKNRQASKKEGEAIIADFLRQVKRIHQESKNEMEFVEKVEKLKSEVSERNNAYIEDLLNRPVETPMIN